MPAHPTWNATTALSLLLALASGCDDGPSYHAPEPFIPEPIEDIAALIDPRIGTQGQGNVIPGALIPHGMVRASPHTENGGGDIDPYQWEASRILGFTHTNLEGPGGSANGYSQLLLMPETGAFDRDDVASTFSHDQETAEPGYYSVQLLDSGIGVELTATGHAAVHRYTFGASEASRVVLDLGHSQGVSIDSELHIDGDTTLWGSATYDVHPVVSFVLRAEPGTTARTTLYFHIELSRAFDSFATFRGDTVSDGSRSEMGRNAGGYVEFATDAGDVLEVRVGVSLISAEQARDNLQAEVGASSFDEIRSRARRAWNEKLNRLRIEADEATRTTFYTALYHSMFQPADYTEASGEFVVATSGVPVVVDGHGRPFYTDDWCMWDTYRTLHPLGTLVEPELRSDIVRSMLIMYEQGGWLPKCTWNATGYSRVMTGNNAIPIIVDAWAKGYRDFDEDLALEAMLKASNEDTDSNVDGLCGYFGLGVPSEYLELGYVGHECDGSQAASMTLEHAYHDFLVGEMAEGLGQETLAAELHERGQWYRNQFDPEVGFMRSRNRDGSWVADFDPEDTSDFNGFVEASSWIFTFFVPHDVPGMIELIGGEAATVERLDGFFASGQFDPSNQPSFHIPWLYNDAGQPAATQLRVRELLATHYGPGPAGLPGNDDAGSTSAFYVLASLGLYPMAPGVPSYHLSTPMVARAELALHPLTGEGGVFVVEVENQAPENNYIQSVSLDGVPVTRPYVDHADIVDGGTLRFVLGPDASSWGQ